MRKLLKKSMILLTLGVMFVSSTIPIFASVTENQNTNSNTQTEVVYNQKSTFSITIPKTIDLGIDKTTNYTVTVCGDISSDEEIIVIPEEKFLMKDINTSNSKADVMATVVQDKTNWIFNKLETIANGTISAPNLTAGIWEGTFFFNIEIQENLAPGLYDENNVMLYSWDELVNNYGIDVEKDYADENLQISASSYWDLPGLRLSYNEDATALNDDLSKCTKLVIGEDVTQIGSGAFYSNATLKEIIIPKTVESINMAAFLYCEKLEKVQIPNSVIVIGYSAFYDCNGLVNITLSENITSVPNNIFRDCNKLINVNIPEKVTEIGSSAFQNCTSLSNIELSENITKIGDSAFRGCSKLTTIELPDTVKTISSDAFRECTSLTSIRLNDGLESIGSSAFAKCTKLSTIYIPNTVTTLKVGDYSVSPFANCSSELLIYCGAESKPTDWANSWNYYASGKTLLTTWNTTREDYNLLAE